MELFIKEKIKKIVQALGSFFSQLMANVRHAAETFAAEEKHDAQAEKPAEDAPAKEPPASETKAAEEKPVDPFSVEEDEFKINIPEFKMDMSDFKVDMTDFDKMFK